MREPSFIDDVARRHRDFVCVTAAGNQGQGDDVARVSGMAAAKNAIARAHACHFRTAQCLRPRHPGSPTSLPQVPDQCKDHIPYTACAGYTNSSDHFARPTKCRAILHVRGNECRGPACLREHRGIIRITASYEGRCRATGSRFDQGYLDQQCRSSGTFRSRTPSRMGFLEYGNGHAGAEQHGPVRL